MCSYVASADVLNVGWVGGWTCISCSCGISDVYAGGLDLKFTSMYSFIFY